MKIINIDNYEVCEENGKFLAASFKDYEGITHQVEMTEELENYLKEVRREEFREKWEKRFHINLEINTNEDLFEINISLNSNNMSTEDVFLEEEIERNIIKEINKLPTIQRNRIYLKIIKDYKNIEIAKKENVDKSAISRSIKVALEKIIKNLKKF